MPRIAEQMQIAQQFGMGKDRRFIEGDKLLASVGDGRKGERALPGGSIHLHRGKGTGDIPHMSR